MCAHRELIPFESTFEKMVLDALTQQNRLHEGDALQPAIHEAAGLRGGFDRPEPTAMYVVPPGASVRTTRPLWTS